MDGFSQKTWKDRDVQYPGKRTLTNVDDNADFQDVIVERAEGATSGGNYTEGDLYFAGVRDEVTHEFPEGSMNDLEERIAKAFAEIYEELAIEFENVYPVGSIYQSFDPTSPEELFSGTTWQALTRVLLPVSTSQASGQNVGNSGNTVTHTPSGSCNIKVTVAGALADLPSHYHSFTNYYNNSTSEKNAGSGSYSRPMVYTTGSASVTTEDAGGNQLHTHTATTTSSIVLNPVTLDIRQQYITMYAWRRTS